VLTYLVAGGAKAIAAGPRSKGGWSDSYPPGHGSNGQHLFHGAIVA